MAVPWRQAGDALILTCRVTPNAALDRIEGIEQRDDGSAVLRIRVTAVPDRNKANQAVIALLATALGRPKSAFSLVSGHTARIKSVAIAGEAPQIAADLADLARLAG